MKTARTHKIVIGGLLAVIAILLFFQLRHAFCCSGHSAPAYPALTALADSIRRQYAPDPRDDVYDIKVLQRSGQPVFKGVTTLPDAKAALLDAGRRSHPGALDSIEVLPSAAVGEKIYGVINVSVADTRTGADYSAEMATQLLLGAPVDILQPSTYWWRIKSADGYVAWTTGSSLVRMNREEFHRWTSAPKIIFTDACGFAYEAPEEGAQRVSDLVFGNLLKYEGERGRFYQATYPDGRTAYVPKRQSKRYEDWRASIRLTEESVVQQALQLKGIPYVWGGTSVKGMDCSGFSKVVYLMHGIVLRRDASQQAKTGIPVDISNGYGNLRPGDLLFFGKKASEGKKERVRHVAIYTGDKAFIHANGYIRINSLDPASPSYDEGNTREFIRAARIIGAGEAEGVRLWQ
ncbi:MAG: C40 family peptidase [Prevotellaceae bacterium]|jgi:cell wall-associated NlpC family hydrolase|nr:C40 family peptidase [Prevotellaceae bacterium]